MKNLRSHMFNFALLPFLLFTSSFSNHSDIKLDVTKTEIYNANIDFGCKERHYTIEDIIGLTTTTCSKSISATGEIFGYGVVRAKLSYRAKKGSYRGVIKGNYVGLKLYYIPSINEWSFRFGRQDMINYKWTWDKERTILGN
jgi:hypothetical protein